MASKYLAGRIVLWCSVVCLHGFSVVDASASVSHGDPMIMAEGSATVRRAVGKRKADHDGDRKTAFVSSAGEISFAETETAKGSAIVRRAVGERKADHDGDRKTASVSDAGEISFAEMDAAEEAQSLCCGKGSKYAELVETGSLSDVPGIIAAALTALTDASQKFMAKPPQIAGGISSLGVALYDVFENTIKPMLPANDNFDWAGFKTNWNSLFINLPAAMAPAEEKFKDFADNGVTASLIEGIGLVLNYTLVHVHGFLPETCKNEPAPGVLADGGGHPGGLAELEAEPVCKAVIKEYFDLVVGTVNSIGSTWKAFEDGDEAKGISEMYDGLKLIINQAVPIEMQTEVYKNVFKLADGLVSSVTTTMADWKQKLTETSVCYMYTTTDLVYAGPATVTLLERAAKVGAPTVGKPRALEDTLLEKGPQKTCSPSQYKHGEKCYKCPTGHFLNRGQCHKNCHGARPIRETFTLPGFNPKCATTMSMLQQANMNQAKEGMNFLGTAIATGVSIFNRADDEKLEAAADAVPAVGLSGGKLMVSFVFQGCDQDSDGR